MNLNKKIQGIILLFCFSFQLSAQLPTITSASSAYTQLSGATALFKDSVWGVDYIYNQFPQKMYTIKLPFKWKFGKYLVDTIYVDCGFIYWYDHDTNVRLGLYTDIMDRGKDIKKSISPVSYKIEGVSPSRIFKIQYQNFGFWGQFHAPVPLSDSGNLQLWIYENAEKYEMHFGVSKIADAANSFQGEAGMDIEYWRMLGDSFLEYNVLTGNISNPAWGDYPTITGMPDNGRVFTFEYKNVSISNLNKLNSSEYFYKSETFLFTNMNTEFVEILDVNGRLISTKKVNNGKADIAELKPGIYFGKVGERVLKFGVD